MKSSILVKTSLVVLLLESGLFISTALGQSRFTLSSGTITFYSSAPVEDIKAETTVISSVIDLDKSSVVFTVPVIGFRFSKRLMQQHFNEQYMESEKYPLATFSGTLSDTGFDKLTKGDVVKTRVNGLLTIKGISKDINVEVELRYGNDVITGHSRMMVRLADYSIKIPRMLIKNIAEEVEVTIDVNYKAEKL
ncbi:MAG: YceI family protein [Bacteroidales bacterium]